MAAQLHNTLHSHRSDNRLCNAVCVGQPSSMTRNNQGSAPCPEWNFVNALYSDFQHFMLTWAGTWAVSWVLLSHQRGGQVPGLQNRAKLPQFTGFFIRPATEKYNSVTILISPTSPPWHLLCVLCNHRDGGDTASTWVIQIVSLKCRRVVKIKESLKPSRIVYILVFVSWQ